MVTYKWQFSFGDVELSVDHVSASSSEKWKDVEKKYSNLVDDLDKDSQNVLKNLIDKNKKKDAALNSNEQDQILLFFNRVAKAEGIEAVLASAAEEEARKAAEAESKRAAEEKRKAAARGSSAAEDKPGSSKYKVVVSESIDFKLEHDGTIKESEVTGVLSVVNNGTKNRIWDIDIELSGGEGVEIDKKIHIPELDPKDEWKQEYTMSVSKDDKPPLVITEEVDAFPDTEGISSTVFIYDENSTGQKAEINIAAENTSDAKISDIQIRKKIPKDFESVDVSSKSDGNTDRDGDEIVWKIPALEPGAKATMDIQFKVYTNEKKVFSSGDLSAKYILEAGTFSGLKPEFADGWSDQIHFVDRDERDEEPDKWDCQFVFDNRSEFPMRLERYTFVFGDENTETLRIDEEIKDLIVEPEKEWESKPWEIDSADEPTFSENVVYSIVPDVQERLSMSQSIAPIELRVLAIEGKKTFSVYEIPSYRETSIDTTITVVTRGKSPIDVIHIEDHIPPNFKNPEKKQFKILIEEKKIPADDFSFSFKPAGDDTSVERVLSVELKDVLENIGELDDETTISITYPLIASKPPRDAKYDAPVLFQAYTKPAGAPIEARIPVDPISVVHQRRKTRIGKAISPGKEKGDYEVMLLYKNKGDAAKKDVPINDFVPDGFDITGSNMDHKETAQAGGKLLTWTIPEVGADQEIEITYSIHGHGNAYSLKNIEAKAFK